jgi:molybdopterin synthase catalytic subunit
MKVDLRETPLSVEEAVGHVSRPEAGGIDVFIGAVREQNEGHEVVQLEYEAYRSMALSELARIAQEVELEFGVRVAALHRVGTLAVGDIAVICAASAVHRHEAFVACRALIDRIKKDVPIWKREHGRDGARWLDPCAPHS